MVGRVVGIPKIVCIVEIGMKVMNRLLHAAAVVLVSLVAFGFAAAADYPPPSEGDWTACALIPNP
jgi:hypothetical protein